MGTPDFSIIIPSFNQGIFLSECIDSIIKAADFANVDCQIILVDNCSTDQTVDVLRQHDKDVDICIVEPDSGQTNAINKGLAFAKGRIVNWLCCDDRLTPQSLAILNREFADSSQPEVVCGRANYFSSGKLLACSRTSQFSPRLDIFMSFARIVQPATFWCSEALAQLTPLDEELSYVMDIDLWLRYLSSKDSACKVVYIEDLLGSIILHDDCKSIANIHGFGAEIAWVKQRMIKMATKKDGSFSACGISSPSALDLGLSVDQLTYIADLVAEVKSFRLLPFRRYVALLLHLPSVIRHLVIVRPEVLRMFS
jgi:glycosyltransferase involved in cell wall biosynthesis